MAENHVFKGANFDKDGNIVREPEDRKVVYEIRPPCCPCTCEEKLSLDKSGFLCPNDIDVGGFMKEIKRGNVTREGQE